MVEFTAHRLRFVAEVVTPMRVEGYSGTGLRAAFFTALTGQFCMNPDALRRVGCPGCPLAQACPVAYLAATLDPNADRGQNIPRPYTIEPPIGARGQGPGSRGDREQGRQGAGETGSRGESGGGGRRETEGAGHLSPIVDRPSSRFEFGMTMFARALSLFPYVVLSLDRMGRQGLGQPLAENRGRRGEFRVREVWAENPVTGERQAVMRTGDNLVTLPDIPVTHDQLCALPVPPRCAYIRVDLLTPTRMKYNQDLIRRAPPFRALFQRILQRLSELAQAFSDTPLDPDLQYTLVGASDKVRLVEDRTRWVQVDSPSSRTHSVSSISGLVGHVVYHTEDWTLFWPWLKWGELIHVGKNAVKGEGMIGVKCEG